MDDHFVAITQYEDWNGVASADDVDANLFDLRKYLQTRELIKRDEFLVGFRVFNGENTEIGGLNPMYVSCFVVPGDDYEAAAEYLSQADPIRCRCIRITISVYEFFMLFKRFSLALSWQKLNVVGREIEYTEGE